MRLFEEVTKFESTMVLISDGSSKIGAHMWSKIAIFVGLLKSTLVGKFKKNQKRTFLVLRIHISVFRGGGLFVKKGNIAKEKKSDDSQKFFSKLGFRGKLILAN